MRADQVLDGTCLCDVLRQRRTGDYWDEKDSA